MDGRGRYHAGEHATQGSMPGWGACHIGEHADRSPWIAYPFNALQMRRTFHHAANAPQLNLRNDSALTHNRFFCIDNTCRFWALHLSCTTLPDHPQLARSAVHINTAAHIFAQRFKPHLGPNRTGSQATLITSRPPTITRIQTPIVSDRYCIGSTVAHHGPSHKLCSRRICKQRSMAGYGILHARTGFKISEDSAFPEDGGIVKVFPLYNQPLPPQR